MREISTEYDSLLDVEEAAEYLGVGQATIYRWCRDGRLPCIKLGKSWRIRRGALVDSLRRSERPATLAGQLYAFLEVPDNVVGIAQNHTMLYRLDAAFFRVGMDHGGTMVKFHGGEPETTADELRASLERLGLPVSSLEDAGRFRFVAESGPPNERADTLRRLADEEAGSGRSVWVAFNWTEQLDLDAALEQQEELTGLVKNEREQFVVKTVVLEEKAEDWPLSAQRRAQSAHSGVIWLTEDGLALSRMTSLARD